MSEFQYYEFVAVDRPLTSAQQGELRALSTRARITSSSFVNEYQWGDLKGDPRVWVEWYFDAHLYLSNWGTRRLLLRWPRKAQAAEVAARYCVGDLARSWTTRSHLMVDLRSDDQNADGEWSEPEGRLAAIVPVRAEVAAGDLRLLYLAWLLGVQSRDVGDGDVEPPVPAGLAELSGPLQAVADFLRLDQDLLAAAAEVSRPLTVKAPAAKVLRRWVAALPAADKDEVILRVLRGEGALLQAELLGRFHGVPDDQPASGPRTAGQVLAAAEAKRSARQQAIRAREAATRRRRELAAAAAREQRLDVLAGDRTAAWARVDVLIESKRPKEYDAAVALLGDLRDLAVRDADRPAFARRLRQLREQHARKPSLLDRLYRAQLG